MNDQDEIISKPKHVELWHGIANGISYEVRRSYMSDGDPFWSVFLFIGIEQMSTSWTENMFVSLNTTSRRIDSASHYQVRNTEFVRLCWDYYHAYDDCEAITLNWCLFDIKEVTDELNRRLQLRHKCFETGVWCDMSQGEFKNGYFVRRQHG